MSIYYVLINFIIDKQYKVISYQKDEYVIDTYIFVWDALYILYYFTIYSIRYN